MLDSWPAVLMGWPSALGGAGLLVAGLLWRRASVVGLGAVVSLGFCVYAAMNPFPFRLLGLLALGGNLFSAFAVSRCRPDLALAAQLPFLALVAALGFAVLVA